MRLLHVACLPFPTYQGTQAAVASILAASTHVGHESHILTYAPGAYDLEVAYTVHRLPDFPRLRSFRSGPSLAKLMLDARGILETRRLARALKPDAVIAHHIEAAMAATAARIGPVHYLAHTSIEAELPSYVPRLPSTQVARLGGVLEARVCRSAVRTGAVAPELAAGLGPEVAYVPVPWRTAVAATPDRASARRSLGVPANAPVCLYAGNLDRYQGWQDLLDALHGLRMTHPNAILVVATESDPRPVFERAAQLGLDRSVRVARLDGESARRRAHEAADLTWIPRRVRGGLPIKMLDAFARRVPVIATKRATAGLPVEGACVVVCDDDPKALADAARDLLWDHDRARQRCDRALEYLHKHHGTEVFDSSFRRFLATIHRSEEYVPSKKNAAIVVEDRSQMLGRT